MGEPLTLKKAITIKLKDPDCKVTFEPGGAVRFKPAPATKLEQLALARAAREKLPEKLAQRKQGKRNRRAGNTFMCTIANILKQWWEHASRGLQSRDGSEFADVEGTDWWVEAKWQKKPSLFGTHDQCVEAQNWTTVGKGKKKKRVKRKHPDTRPRLIVLKRFGDGVTYWCCEQEEFLRLMKAEQDLEKLLALGYEVPE